MTHEQPYMANSYQKYPNQYYGQGNNPNNPNNQNNYSYNNNPFVKNARFVNREISANMGMRRTVS